MKPNPNESVETSVVPGADEDEGLTELPVIGHRSGLCRPSGGDGSDAGWLLAELSRAEERERRRIAAELHGTVSQTLAAMAMRLCLLEKRAQDSHCRQAIAELEELLQQAIDSTRCLVYKLCPPSLHLDGLGGGLLTLSEAFARQHGMKVRIERSDQEPPLGEELRIFLYNAVRELLFNAVKHAEASKASVTLQWHEGRFDVTVRDNGIGFRVPPGQAHRKAGFGLFNIRERLTLLGGRLEVKSLAGQGATVQICIPIPQTAAKSRPDTVDSRERALSREPPEAG